jgi:hypothetical protein
VRRGDETGSGESTEVGQIQVNCGVGTLMEVVVDAGDGAGSSTPARGHRRRRAWGGVMRAALHVYIPVSLRTLTGIRLCT